MLPNSTAIQQFVFYDKYSRYNYDLGRRERWEETIQRVTDHLRWMSDNKLTDEEYQEIYDLMYKGVVSPSMRLMATAGEAARKNVLLGYNCAFLPIVSLPCFGEVLWLSMSGVGVGYSVERKYVGLLPVVKEADPVAETVKFIIEDSAEGWVAAFNLAIHLFWSGNDVEFDYSHIRPAGAPLRTKGGQASGPEPLEDLMESARKIIRGAVGRKLRPIEVFDLLTVVGACAVSGGVRRCLSHDTMVQARHGLTKISDIKIGDEVQTIDGYRRVTNTFDQGHHDVIELVLENGSTIKCTPDHRLAVVASVHGEIKWKKAEDLLEEDRLVFVTSGIDGEDIPVVHSLESYAEADNIRTELSLPSVLGVDDAWVLGKMLADGHIYIGELYGNDNGNCRTSFSCNSNEDEQIDRIVDWFSKVGVDAAVREHSGNWVTIDSGVRRLAKWFYNYKQPNAPISIPEEVLRGSTKTRAAFLAGVFDGDGAAGNRPVVLCSTIYPEFAHSLQEVYASLGIITEVFLNRPETEDGWKPLYHLSVKDGTAFGRFVSTILPHSTKANDVVPRQKYQYGYTYPKAMVKKDLKRKEYGRLYDGRNPRGMNSYTLNTKITGREIITPVKVMSISAAGKEHTFDIEVEGEHSFVLGSGILSHNSAQITLFSRDDEEMRTSKDGAFWNEHPYRVNANISAVWEEELTREQIAEQMNSMYAGQSGEPGIVSRYAMKMSQPERRRELVHGGTNPCQPSFATVLTPDGIARFSEVGIGDTIWSGHEWTTIVNKWSTGVKPVYRYLTSHGEFVGTENHRVFQNGERVEVKDAVSIDVSPLPSWNSIDDPRPIDPVTSSSEIRSRSYLGEYEVFDITVSADSHSYWTGGLKVSNCGEVFLHGTTKQGEFGGQLCNLSAVNVKPNMSLHEIEQAARVAAMIGTIQAAATDFRLLRPAWKEICEEERLIGVSLVGIADCPLLQDVTNLHKIKLAVMEQNLETAEILDINPSPATTCTKPAGNSSVMYGTARGMNARYAPYYIRRVRVGSKSPLIPVLSAAGADLRPENGQDSLEAATTLVASFYEASPEDALTTSQMTALDQLSLWEIVKLGFTEHNPSVTIEYLPHEEHEIINWIYDRQEIIGGLSFLPKDDAVYEQAPYEEITKEHYENAPKIVLDWSILEATETKDNTSFDLECAGGVCDLR